MTDGKTVELPANYYFFGDPARVIDRASQLAKLDGDPNVQEQRQQFAWEVLSFCPVPFLDELIEALIAKTEESIKTLRDKASRSEINLRMRNFAEEEKNQISALALQILSEKILNSDTEEILPILSFIQEYIKRQMNQQSKVDQEIMYLEKEKALLNEQIAMKREELVEDKKAIFLEFLAKLTKEDF
jgi:hypothetical protein